MNRIQKNKLFEHMIELLELPDYAYEKAKSRYEDIGEWLHRKEGECSSYDPHIFTQGSFRLGTAIRPLNNNEKYDLDLVCNLESGISKKTNSQKELKELVGDDVESYREVNGIKEPILEKHRCWRLEYQDDISFHMDIIPCIPEEEYGKKTIEKAMFDSGIYEGLANSIANLTVSITDNRYPKYSQIYDNWPISNPEGYARWFESRMKLAEHFLYKRADVLKVANIEDLPIFKWKTPLQRCVQILKRHRDQMFKDNPDVKPISVIITTLAGKTYNGETDIVSAIDCILSQMGNLINQNSPRVPNPVNPKEDFADKWAISKYNHLRLEENFWNWLQQAKADFQSMGTYDDENFILEQAMRKFWIQLDASNISKKLGFVATSNIFIPKEHDIKTSAKPWQMEH